MTEDVLTAAAVIGWLRRCADAYAAHEEELTQLDAAIGDADHGANMARGFAAVRAKLPDLEGQDIGTVLKVTGLTLLSTVGGASGPLYGSFFLQAARGAGERTELSRSALVDCFRGGVEGLVSRGRAEVGEKTMVDAVVPALAALEASANLPLNEALDQVVLAALQGRDSTVPLIARKGRASYLGERSAGHVDPGASSAVLLLEALAEAARAGN
jgi:dihydroxyacetone kinase-like protein